MPNLRNVKSQVTIVIFIVALVAFIACSGSGSNGLAPPLAPQPTVSVARVAFPITEPTRAADRAKPTEDAAPKGEATSLEETPAATVELAPTATPVPTPSSEAVPESTPEPVVEPVAKIVEAPPPTPGAVEPPEPTPAPKIFPAVEPAAKQASVLVPAATLVETVDEFGFVLNLDGGPMLRPQGGQIRIPVWNKEL